MKVKTIKTEHIGAQLKKFRMERGLTYDQVAERGGIYKYTIVSCETGHVPSLKTLIKILKVYGYGIYLGRKKDVEGRCEDEHDHRDV